MKIGFGMLRMQVHLLGVFEGLRAWWSIQSLLNKARPTSEILAELEMLAEQSPTNDK